MVMPPEQCGDLDSKLIHSDTASRNLGPALDWSLLDSAEAHIVAEQRTDKVHVRERSDTALLHPPLSPTFYKAAFKSSQKPGLQWTKSQPKLQKRPVAVSKPKITTVTVKKNSRNSPSLKIIRSAKDEGTSQMTKFSQSPSGSLAKMKEVRSSCSTLPLPKRVTVSLADTEARRFSAASPITPTLTSSMKTQKSSVISSHQRRSSDDLPVWIQTSRGASPIMLENLELVEKESIRRQFGKTALGKETSRLHALSRTPKGGFQLSPPAKPREKPPVTEVRGVEVIPPALNLSEIAKKDNQSLSIDEMGGEGSDDDSVLRDDWT